MVVELSGCLFLIVVYLCLWYVAFQCYDLLGMQFIDNLMRLWNLIDFVVYCVIVFCFYFGFCFGAEGFILKFIYNG